mgnify:CR=1 FL=1
MNMERVSRVMDNLEKLGMGQVLVADPMSIWYLTGYWNVPYERFYALYLARDAEARTTQATLFCNRLFPDASQTGARVVTFDDTEDPVALVAEATRHGEPLGVDKVLAARWLLPLMDAHVASEVHLGSPAVDDARSIKDARELDLMRAASATNDQAMAWLRSQLHEGVTEHEIASGLLAEYRRLGAQDHSFTPIVSFGANAADPHHEPDGTRLRAGDVALFDVGCRRDSYCSDMTRTVALGFVSEEMDKVYKTVLKAQLAGIAATKAGVAGRDIDGTARKVIADAGYGDYFGHGYGHSLGILIHEAPNANTRNDQPMPAGAVVSAEPGIYLPGKFGVRIEDVTVITETGCEVLTKSPKNLIIL